MTHPGAVGAAKTIETVQYLRAAACLSVLAYHVMGGEDSGTFYVGQAGVDLFFVISGFIMWTVTEARETRPLPFVKRRLLRILPLYWFVTSVVFAKRCLVHTQDLGDLLCSLFFIPHAYTHGSTYPLVIPGWTLNYEMFFYAVFAGVLVLPRARQLAAMAVLFGVAVLSRAVVPPANLAVLTYSDPIILEFVGGAAIAALRRAGRFPGVAAGAVLFTAGLLALVAEQVTGLHPLAWRAVLWGLPCAGMLTGAIALDGWAPRIGALRVLGDASYAIYLVHDPIINLAAGLNYGAVPMACFEAALGLSVGLALHAAEGRVMRWLRARPVALAPAPR